MQKFKSNSLINQRIMIKLSLRLTNIRAMIIFEKTSTHGGLMDRNSWKYLRNISERQESVHNVRTVPMMLVGMKYNAKGEFTNCKGRLVSGGHRTDPNSYDPLEKHSPTVPIEVANLQLGMASYAKAQVETYDIPVVYLNAMLKEERYQVMRIPKHLVNC